MSQYQHSPENRYFFRRFVGSYSTIWCDDCTIICTCTRRCSCSLDSRPIISSRVAGVFRLASLVVEAESLILPAKLELWAAAAVASVTPLSPSLFLWLLFVVYTLKLFQFMVFFCVERYVFLSHWTNQLNSTGRLKCMVGSRPRSSGIIIVK